MNILDAIFRNPVTDEVDVDREKRDRIEFHRTHVRNGPRSFGTVSNGQIRRQQKRDQASRRRKATQGVRRRHFQDRLAQASLRGRLSVVGAEPGTYSEALVQNAAGSLEKQFGSIDQARRSSKVRR